MEVDHLRARPGLRDLDLLEHTPATVAGKPGFWLVYTWKTSRGLRLKGVEYGIVDGQWIYRLAYEAIARHYFDRDLSAFEATVASFRLVKERVWRGPAAPEWQREAFTALPS
jgi:hypothetical protein